MLIKRDADLWDFHEEGNWIVVTTNTVVKKNGEAVMGAGIAGDAASRFPDLPKLYGKFLLSSHEKSGVALVPAIRLILFPTKYDWKDDSNLDLIKKNAGSLVDRVAESKALTNAPIMHVYLPPPGCGLGRRKWEEVEPIISPILDDNFTVVFR